MEKWSKPVTSGLQIPTSFSPKFTFQNKKLISRGEGKKGLSAFFIYIHLDPSICCLTTLLQPNIRDYNYRNVPHG